MTSIKFLFIYNGVVFYPQKLQFGRKYSLKSLIKKLSKLKNKI